MVCVDCSAATATEEEVERNLGMEASKEDFDTSEPLGWDCNVEVCCAWVGGVRGCIA